MNRSVNALGEKQDRQRVHVAVEGPFPVPSLRVDPTLVERALTNLLRNAIEASPGGRVRCSWEVENGVVGLRVEDDGPGVNAEVRRRIFEPFYTTKKFGENPGLGLAVARAIVEEHGGRVEIGESDLGGASFTMYFEAPSDSTATGS